MPNDEPQVFAIQHDLHKGWIFTRRGFLAAAGLAAAAASCGSDDKGETDLSKRTFKQLPTFSPEEREAACTQASIGSELAMISPDSTLLVTRGDPGPVKLWSLPDGALLKSLPGAGKKPYTGSSDLLITPDGSLLIAHIYTADSPSSINAWSLPQGELVYSIPDVDPVQLALTPDGKTLVSINAQGEFQDWSQVEITTRSVADGSPVNTFSLPDSHLSYISVLPDGSGLLTVKQGEADYLRGESSLVELKLWSLDDGTLIREMGSFSLFKGGVWGLSPDGSLLIVTEEASPDDLHAVQSVKLWSLAGGAFVATLFAYLYDENLPVDIGWPVLIVNDLVLAPALGEVDYLCAWSLPDGKFLQALEVGQPGTITGLTLESMLVTPDQSTLITVVDNQSSIKLWSLPDLTLIKTFDLPDSFFDEYGNTVLNDLWDALISPDGSLLVVGGGGNLTEKLIFSLPDGKLLSCPVDVESILSGTRGALVTRPDGTFVHQPCGAPIAEGGVCTCNCVEGLGCSCDSYSSGGGHYWHPN